MKQILLVITAIFLLSGCTGADDSQLESFYEDVVAQQDKKPRIPKKPSIPDQKIAQANLLDFEAHESSELDMDRLIEKINESLEQPTITVEEIERGWYYGNEEEKKVGTPSSWIWIGEGAKSRWVSPNMIEEVEDIEIDELCRKTAGTFVISCIEREAENCEYIPQSKCRCLSGTKWVDDQGCILVDELADEEDQFIEIEPDELKQGWYFGLPNEKKLNTPTNWIWVENGMASRWQNPSPIR